MNEWISNSIKIANSTGYLDRLQEVYPVVQETEREIDPEIQKELQQSYMAADDITLIRKLLRLPKFPINDPYVAFFRKNDIFLEYNPQTAKRIAMQIRAMGFEAMIKGIREPKVVTKKFGQLFKRWIQKIGYPILAETEFEAYDKGIVFLQGGDAKLSDFANRRLGCDLDKGIDFLVKAGEIYLIGEAKFLTDYGGAQNANFQVALRFLRDKKGKAIRIAVLDGVIWIKARTTMYRTICELEDTALTSLLLKRFLQSLKRG